MPNISKIADPRSWARWRNCGAVPKPNTILRYRVRDLMRNSYVTRGGTIDPWGTIRILVVGVPEGKRVQDPCDILQPGLAIWSNELVGLSPDHRASMEGEDIVVRKNGDMMMRIHPRECQTAEIRECLVDASGTLQSVLVAQHFPGVRKNLELALLRAEQGEKPQVLDNSVFVQVAKNLVGQRVVQVVFRREDATLVFSRTGEQIPCRCHQPLAFEKWGVSGPH